MAHVVDAATVCDALDAGVDAFTHVPLDAPLPEELVDRAAAEGRVVIPTLAMMEVSSGADVGRALADDDRIAAWLHRAGARLPAGTDANNAPGSSCPVVHGAALHRGLELLVAAGLTPTEALTPATAAPALHFGLHDRGRIAPGLRADVVLVEGDPKQDITATRAIRRIWRRGVPFHRTACPTDRAQAPQTDGALVPPDRSRTRAQPTAAGC